MKETYETGLQGENTAEAWLTREKGMICLERRYRSKAGEIDLIMADRESIVFVEVKTRRTAAPGQGLLTVDARKQRRIANAARLYLMAKGWLNRPIRFDIVEITRETVLHIPNAFQPGGMFYH